MKKKCFVFVFCVFQFFYSSFAANNSECYIEVVLNGSVAGNGFHRLLHWAVVIRGDDIKQFNDVCQLAVHQTLPNGVFVDPEQLNELSHSHKSNNIFYVKEKVDVESSKETSNPISVVVYHKFGGGTADGKSRENSSNLIQYSFLLPIHVRYHAPSYGGGYKKIKIPPASLLGRCPIVHDNKSYTKNVILKIMSPPCSESSHLHLPCVMGLNYIDDKILCDDWKLIGYADKTKLVKHSEKSHKGTEEEELELMVPVGDLEHLWLVQIVTLTVANSAAIYIVYYIVNFALSH